MLKTVKFAHLSDLHLGSWRNKILTDLNLKTFQKTIKDIIEEKIDFCIFAGDIFNSPIPDLEIVNLVIKEFLKLKDNNIPLYVIGGSHDYSNSGKSFINLLETAKILKDIGKFEKLDDNSINLKYLIDEDNKTILCGISGKKKGLEKNIYLNINEPKLKKDYLKIFLFHCTLNDIKPIFLENVKFQTTSSNLPENFDYYAGGHIHTHIKKNLKNSILSYSGVLFPNNFQELKKEVPTYNICEYNFITKKIELTVKHPIIYEKEFIEIDSNSLNPIQIRQEIENKILNLDIEDKIILIELKGEIDGKISDIELNKIIKNLYLQKAKIVLKNTYKLKNKNLNIKLKEITNKSIKEIENQIITQVIKPNSKYLNLINKILDSDFSKNFDEKNLDYEKRIEKIYSKLIK